MRGCQNHGPFLGTLKIRCRLIIGIQKGTIILTTTHMFNEQEREKSAWISRGGGGSPAFFIGRI